MPTTEQPLFLPGDIGDQTSLLASRCTSCQRAEFPARNTCPACGYTATSIALHPTATARTVTAVLAQPPGSKRQAPYDVCVAEFTEGICIIGLADGHIEQGDHILTTIIEAFPGHETFAFQRTQTTKPQ